MYRRNVLKTGGGIIGLGILGATQAQANDHKEGHGPGDDRDRSKRSEAERVTLGPGDVVERQSDPEQDNFEAEFAFWRVDHGIEYDEAEYQGSARLGPDNFGLFGSDTGSFWFGVTAPDEDGIQHPIDHQGQESLFMYVEEEDQWYELRAQFTGQGDLKNVNGVSPE